ncbi:MAG TPA: hypothetical protein VMV00_01750 [Candidatus Baltobacteraceae bacterium]|nr:hypothetical protein [Candidatus Baltobacteraceae bacterium]
MPVGFVSRGDSGEIKLEYSAPDGNVRKLWERVSDSILETMFDSEGGILEQRLHKGGANAEEFLSNESKTHKLELKESKYESIRLDKSCPTCNTPNPSRHVEAFRSAGEVPVMPTYHCKQCATKSYYLTEGYLDNLVRGNSSMFTGNELKELQADEAAFKAELKAYIIRIFASKRIVCIK